MNNHEQCSKDCYCFFHVMARFFKQCSSTVNNQDRNFRPGQQTTRCSINLTPTYKISTYPSVPCTRIRCPSLISLVAFSTPITAGMPYSRAITAPCVISPPTSVTRPFMETNKGVQLGSVKEVTNISPSLRSASSTF